MVTGNAQYVTVEEKLIHVHIVIVAGRSRVVIVMVVDVLTHHVSDVTGKVQYILQILGGEPTVVLVLDAMVLALKNVVGAQWDVKDAIFVQEADIGISARLVKERDMFLLMLTIMSKFEHQIVVSYRKS